MSHNAKKKRMGSRRQMAHQNKTSEAEEFPEKDSVSAAQHSVPEGNLDGSQSEGQNSPAPELGVGRRKLGSRRKNKGPHVEDFGTESPHNSREGDKEPSSCETCEVTQMTTERQEQLHQGCEHEITFVGSFSSLYSSSTPGYASQVQSSAPTTCPEADTESLNPESEPLRTEQEEDDMERQAAADPCNLEETTKTEKSDLLHSEEFKEHTHLVSISELTSSSVSLYPEVGQQLTDESKSVDVPEELPKVCSVTEEESKDRENDTASFRQDENWQGDYLLSEPQKSVSQQCNTPPGSSADQSSAKVNTERENSVKRAVVSSSKEKLPENEEQNKPLNVQGKLVQHSEDDRTQEQEVKSNEMHGTAPESSETLPGNLMDEDVVIHTYPSEMIVKSTDNFATIQGGLNPDDKRDPSKENRLMTLDHTNQDHYATDSTSATERADTAPGQAYEGQAEDGLKPTAEQTVHQKREEQLFSGMENSSPSHTLTSEIHGSLDFQTQQNNTNLNPSHANECVADLYHRPTEEAFGNSSNNGSLETTKQLFAMETDVLEKSMETTPGGRDIFHIAQTEEVNNQVNENTHSGAHGGISELTALHLTVEQQLIEPSDPANIPEEGLPSVSSEATEDSKEEGVDGNLQHDCTASETQLKCANISSDTLKILAGKHHPRDPADSECSAEAVVSSFQPSEEDVNVHARDVEPKHLHEMHQIEFSLHTMQPEMNAPLDHQPHDSTGKLEETHTGSNPTGNEAEVGSRQRNQGLQEAGESIFEPHHKHRDVAAGSTDVDGMFERKQLVEATYRAVQEEDQKCEREDDVPAIQGSFLHAAMAEVQSAAETNHPESDLESFIPKIETLLAHDKGEADFQVEVCDKSVGAALDEMGKYAQLHDQEIKCSRLSPNEQEEEQEMKPTQVHYINHSSENVTHDDAQSSQMMSTNLIIQVPVTDIYQSEPSTDGSAMMQDIPKSDDKWEVDPTKGKNFESLDQTNDPHQTQQNDTEANPFGSRRKLGSSRRNKGRRRANEPVADLYHRSAEEAFGNSSDNESIETTKMPFTTESEVRDQVSENANDGSPVDVSQQSVSALHSSSALDQQLIDQSNSSEMLQRLPDVDSVTERKGGDENKELVRQEENSQHSHLVRESHVESEDRESPILKIIQGESCAETQMDIQSSVEQTAFSESKEELSSDGEHVSLSEGRRSFDAVSEVQEETDKPAQMQEMHPADYSSIRKSELCLQTLQTETDCPLDCQPQDNSMTKKEEQTHTVSRLTGNRRKMGSSRRHKRQHVKDSVTDEPEDQTVDKTKAEEVVQPTEMSLAMTTTAQTVLKEHTNLDLKHAQEIISAENEEENATTMSEEDTVLSQNAMANVKNVTTDVTSCSGEENSAAREKNPSEAAESLRYLAGYGSVQIDSLQSNTQNISYCDDHVATRSLTLDAPQQADACQVKKVEALSPEDERLRSVVSGQDDAGENSEESTDKAPDRKVSQRITYAEPFSAGPSAPFVLQENFRACPAVDVPRETGQLSTEAACDNQQWMQEKASLERSQQQRRKMGSTRRTHRNRESEDGTDDQDEIKEVSFNMQADVKDLKKMEEAVQQTGVFAAAVSQNRNAEASPNHVEQQETNEASTLHIDGQKLHSNTSDLQSELGSMISDRDDGTPLLPWPSASRSEEVRLVQAADMEDSDKNLDVSMEPPQSDGSTGTEVKITSKSLSLSSSTEEEYLQNDEGRLESVNVTQMHALKAAEESIVAKSGVSGGVGEEHEDLQADDKNPGVSPANRRRKMGSTRRTLKSKRKEEDMHEQKGVGNEATEAATSITDVKTQRLEDNAIDSEQRKEIVVETVEYSHISESHLKPPSDQTFEEGTHDQVVETEHQPSPSHFPERPSSAVMSETASGGRRRKLGSHRKSHGHQGNKKQIATWERITDPQNESSIAVESIIETPEEESSGLDKVSEVSSKTAF